MPELNFAKKDRAKPFNVSLSKIADTPTGKARAKLYLKNGSTKSKRVTIPACPVAQGA